MYARDIVQLILKYNRLFWVRWACRASEVYSCLVLNKHVIIKLWYIVQILNKEH